eukprot:GHVT01028170.1.p1 GENE.GHVT01028170.1~~GHVT01028170.1.p1  ORF type:complete len:417 (-),score=139.48 GHVT01028170.1:689-1939(-)
MDMLRRAGLIDEQARCSGLAALTTYLLEHQPSNLIFNFLLLSGKLHDYLLGQNGMPPLRSLERAAGSSPSASSPSSGAASAFVGGSAAGRTPVEVERELRLLEVIAHSTSLLPLTKSALLSKALQATGALTDDADKHKTTSANSPVFCPGVSPLLPVLPQKLEDVFNQFNQLALSSATDCLLAFCQSLQGKHLKWTGRDTALPLTRVAYTAAADQGDDAAQAAEKRADEQQKTILTNNQPIFDGESTFLDVYSKMISPNATRSPFAALSGVPEDSFGSVASLCEEARAGMHVTGDVVAALSVQKLALPLSGEALAAPATKARRKSAAGSAVEAKLINSYLVDFYMHGNLAELTRVNRISPADVWTLISTAIKFLEFFERGVRLLVPAARRGDDVVYGTVRGLLGSLEKLLKEKQEE